MPKVVEGDVVTVETVEVGVPEGFSEPVDHSLLDVRLAEEPKSDWVDPSTVVDTVVLGYVEATAEVVPTV